MLKHRWENVVQFMTYSVVIHAWHDDYESVYSRSWIKFELVFDDLPSFFYSIAHSKTRTVNLSDQSKRAPTENRCPTGVDTLSLPTIAGIQFPLVELSNDQHNIMMATHTTGSWKSYSFTHAACYVTLRTFSRSIRKSHVELCVGSFESRKTPLN